MGLGYALRLRRHDSGTAFCSCCCCACCGWRGTTQLPRACSVVAMANGEMNPEALHTKPNCKLRGRRKGEQERRSSSPRRKTGDWIEHCRAAPRAIPPKQSRLCSRSRIRTQLGRAVRNGRYHRNRDLAAKERSPSVLRLPIFGMASCICAKTRLGLPLQILFIARSGHHGGQDGALPSCLCKHLDIKGYIGVSLSYYMISHPCAVFAARTSGLPIQMQPPTSLCNPSLVSTIVTRSLPCFGIVSLPRISSCFGATHVRRQRILLGLRQRARSETLSLKNKTAG